MNCFFQLFHNRFVYHLLENYATIVLLLCSTVFLITFLALFYQSWGTYTEKQKKLNYVCIASFLCLHLAIAFHVVPSEKITFVEYTFFSIAWLSFLISKTPIAK